MTQHVQARWDNTLMRLRIVEWALHHRRIESPRLVKHEQLVGEVNDGCRWCH
ncbi:hypothetical protein O9992_22630 [Vibrio lentus]|nr:hypothetical protein [Vibrio lentus]